MIGLDAGIYAVFADGATSTAVLGLDVDTTAQPPASGSGEAEGIVVLPRDTSRDIVCDRASPSTRGCSLGPPPSASPGGRRE
ncbi:MAG: hypothetical protein U0325_31550 [Polyangiales bacterium]